MVRVSTESELLLAKAAWGRTINCVRSVPAALLGMLNKYAQCQIRPHTRNSGKAAGHQPLIVLDPEGQND